MVTIDWNACTGCGTCVGDCVAMALEVSEGKAVCSDRCFRCGHCVALCPENAATIPEYEMEDVEARREEGLDSEALLHQMKFRRSVRQYQDRAVEREKLERIVQAGRYAATAVNRQACRFVVVEAELGAFKELVWRGIQGLIAAPEAQPPEVLSLLQRLLHLYRDKQVDYLFRDAPAVVFVGAENTIDGGLAAQNMELMAVSQGLGMLYNGYLTRIANALPEAGAWLGLGEVPVAICMLAGYPRIQYRRTAPRRSAHVHWR